MRVILRPGAGEEVDVVGQIIGFIEMSAEEQNGPAQFRYDDRQTRGDAAAPESGGG
jgi:hypothetical protein